MHRSRPVSNVAMVCIALLFLIGAIHVPCFIFGDLRWEDPVSFRKSILFGFSTGMTLWSCLHVLSHLRPKRGDGLVETTLSVSLLFEVLLIAMQAWRGESSHFNSTGLFNASVEKGMLFLIAIAMVLICWIAVRSFLPNQLDGVPREMRLAIQAGMGFLVVSGMIGFAITFLGNLNVSLGMSPEIWPPTGVMKFPHGAALHAVQILTVAAWISRRISSRNGTFAVGFAILSHIIWLAYALYQTVQGRDRFDTSSASWVLIVLTTATAIGAIWNLLPKRSIDAIRRSKLHDQLG